MNKLKNYIVHLSYGHDTNSRGRFKIKAKSKQNAYDKAVMYHYNLLSIKELDEIFKQKGVIYSPYGCVEEVEND
jgi:hypothetical protein